jgi:hypothetical protein
MVWEVTRLAFVVCLLTPFCWLGNAGTPGECVQRFRQIKAYVMARALLNASFQSGPIGEDGWETFGAGNPHLKSERVQGGIQ